MGLLQSVAIARRSGADRRFGFSLRLQCHSDQAGGRQRGLGGGSEPISAPRRPRSQSGRDRSGLRQAGKGRLCPGHRGARQGDLDSPRRQRPDRPGKGQRAAGCAKRAVGRPRASAGGQRKLSRPQIERRISSRCNPSSRGPRTGSLSPAATTSPRCRTSTPRCRTFPSVLWAQTVFRSIKPLVPFTADSEAQAAPKVKF